MDWDAAELTCITEEKQMNGKDLQPGDVIIMFVESCGAFHSLIYMGEGRLSHAAKGTNSEGKNVSGVNSTGLRKYFHDGAVKNDGMGPIREEPSCNVYRCIKPEGLGRIAAKYARNWVTASTKDVDWQHEQVTLKTQ
jgi:hypothetical protein